MGTTSIEWTNKTWNPVVGCTWASDGCTNCYAARMTRRLEAMGKPDYIGLTSKKHFNGTVRTLEHRLTDPLSWRKPRRVFVNSMSDLFHPSVPFEFIDKVFAVMLQHTYQILTKWPERMAEYLSGRADGATRWACVAYALSKVTTTLDGRNPSGRTIDREDWPLPNVWLGTSVEDQQRADERIPHLLRCPAAVRFLSCEPLIAPIELAHHFPSAHGKRNDQFWVIVGGESGPGARPCDVSWIRSIVQQCKAAGVPVFVKQMGANVGMTNPTGDQVREWGETKIVKADDGVRLLLKDSKGGDIDEFPLDLRVREFPKGAP